VPYALPAEDIRPALESGLIDGAEFSLPAINAELGIADVARHLYLPGWQQPVTSLELLMPAQTWSALSDRHKAVLDAACEESLSRTADEARIQNVAALAEFRAQGIELHRWPDEVIAEDVARYPRLADAWQSSLHVREYYDDWQARDYTE